MENMLLCSAICDIINIDFIRKTHCGATDASNGFQSKFFNESSQNVNVPGVLRHFAQINRTY